MEIKLSNPYLHAFFLSVCLFVCLFVGVFVCLFGCLFFHPYLQLFSLFQVVLFMKKTLNKTIFYDELSKRPEAVNQYIAYIKTHHDRRDSVATEMGYVAVVINSSSYCLKVHDPIFQNNVFMFLLEICFLSRDINFKFWLKRYSVNLTTSFYDMNQ